MSKNVTKRRSDSWEMLDEGKSRKRVLVLHNDDVNTFEHVIESLVQVCKHDSVQAEQCAMITHYNGKCDIRRGSVSVLKPMRRALLDRGLQATID